MSQPMPSPTAAQVAIAEQITGPCRCDPAYREYVTASDCVRCHYAADIAQALAAREAAVREEMEERIRTANRERNEAIERAEDMTDGFKAEMSRGDDLMVQLRRAEAALAAVRAETWEAAAKLVESSMKTGITSSLAAALRAPEPPR